MPPRKAGRTKNAASAPARIVPVKIEIPLPSKPVYVPGAGSRPAPISLTPARDSTAYILDKYVLPKLSECGPKDRRLVYYLVGFRDLPEVRTLVPCHKAQEYVDPATIEEWESEQHNKLMDERARLKEEAAKKKKKVGRPPKIKDDPAELDYSKPSPRGTVTASTPTGSEHHGRMLDTQLTGPSLSTPQKRPRSSLDQLGQLDRLDQEEAGPTPEPNTKANSKSDAKTQTQPRTTTSTSTASSFTSSRNVNRLSVREEEAIRRQLFHSATKHRLSPSYSPPVNQQHQDLAAESATMPRRGKPYPGHLRHLRDNASTSRASSSSQASTSAGQPTQPTPSQPAPSQPAPSVSSSGGRQTRSATRNSRPSTSGSASVDSPSGTGTGTPQIHPDWAQIMKFSNKVMDVMDTLAPQYNIQPANAAAASSGSTANTNNPLTTHPAFAASWGGDRLPLPNSQGILPSTEKASPAPEPSRSQKGKKRSPKETPDEDAQAKKRRKTSKPKPKEEKEPSEDESWSVERLLRDEFRYLDGRRALYYLVQWTGNYEPTWEPASNIIDKELVRVYKAQKKEGALPAMPANASYSAVSDAFRGDLDDDKNDDLVREDEEEEEDEILGVTDPATTTTPLPSSGKKRVA
ncbi:hypothetical protein V8F06_007402 [Rhypophila decipiens]